MLADGLSSSAAGSSTASSIFGRSFNKLWQEISENVVEFLHPFTTFSLPYWWALALEIFQFIQYISYGFTAADIGEWSTFGYYFSIPRAFILFTWKSYVNLFWFVFSVSIFT